MRGLRKVLPPFAPDASGAVSVLYELGGLLVICDAGGCAGNICGFDEPRWLTRRSAVFSAGLREMDAILGRDEKLVEKLTEAVRDLDVAFAAVIGTPVPAVIGTDYRALRRLAERRTGLPVLTLDTDGTKLCDVGEEKAFQALCETFATESYPPERGRIGVLGATPLELSDLRAPEKIRCALGTEEESVVCYGMGSGLCEVKRASAAEKNLVVAPCALRTAQSLQEKFGTPYEVGYPPARDWFPEAGVRGKRVLIVHQQVIADTLRDAFERRGAAAVTVAGWFPLRPELAREGDVFLAEEDDFARLVREGDYDVIAADPCMAEMIPEFGGTFLPAPHFAVSGTMIGD